MEVVARVEKYAGDNACQVPSQSPPLERRGVVVAMTVPVPSAARKVPAAVAREKRTGATENELAPLHVLLLASKVVEATTMFPEPSNETPLIVTGEASLVAVPALPVTLMDTAVEVETEAMVLTPVA